MIKKFMPNNFTVKLVVAAAIVTDAEDIIDYVRLKCIEYLAPYKVPTKFIKLDGLPKNSGGKIEKSKLQELMSIKDL